MGTAHPTIRNFRNVIIPSTFWYSQSSLRSPAYSHLLTFSTSHLLSFPTFHLSPFFLTPETSIEHPRFAQTSNQYPEHRVSSIPASRDLRSAQTSIEHQVSSIKYRASSIQHPASPSMKINQAAKVSHSARAKSCPETASRSRFRYPVFPRF